MANRYATLAATLLVAGATGTSLYTASTAQEARTAISAAQHVTTTHGDLAVHVDAGLARLPVGTEGHVLTVTSGAPAWTAPSGGGLTITTFHASDFVVEPGGATAGNATKTGTGPGSTITLTSATPGTSYGYSGSDAPRAVLEIPAGAREIEATMEVTSTTGTGDTWRYFGLALRNAPTGGAPSSLWGVGYQTAATPSAYPGPLMSGLNTGAGAVGVYSGTGIFAAGRWLRATWRPTEIHFAFVTGAGAASARPTVWYPPATAALPVHASGALSVGDTEGPLGLVALLQTFGGSGNLVMTFEITVRVVVGS